MSYSSPFFLNHTSFFSALQLLWGPDSLSMSLFGQSCFHSYGMKTQLFAPLYCRWQVWVWKEAKWNVDCIFFWPLPHAFCVHFWFSRMSFLFQNFSWGIKKYFTFKTEPQSGHFTMHFSKGKWSENCQQVSLILRRIVQYQDGRNLGDHLVQPFLA